MPIRRKPKMSAQASLLPGVRIDKTSNRAVYLQLYAGIKQLILEGVIPAGASIPSPRLVASEFGCSRHTVATAYDFLIAEGLLSASHGVGTFVSELVETALKAAGSNPSAGPTDAFIRQSQFADILERGRIDRDEEDPLQIFGAPDAECFPYTLWTKIYASIWSNPKRELLHVTSAQGYDRLRSAICTFVHGTRGIRATPEQVLITSGTTQSVDLLLRALLNPGDEVWVEDPGRPKAATLVSALGLKRVSVPVDHHGLRVDVAEQLAPDAKVALVTPSHHYPTGATLALERRLHLLAWANRSGAWIFEDDYDGELIADGHPILPIYSLGKNDRVIYLGTFSKSISPQLRLGYIICHPELARRLVRLRFYVDYFPSMNLQPVLAEFIEKGHLDSYVRRMRRIYRERQSTFVAAIEATADGAFEVFKNAPALFQPLGLRDERIGNNDVILAERARKLGIPAFALSSFSFNVKPRPGIIIGTGRLPLERIPSAVNRLVQATRDMQNIITAAEESS
ncbi:PLP-dependent aminotransferase family protein [Mesorhizobium sp. M7A.F.Ca.US.006.01.1.1]|uniref:MocR-like pyridoxine biosynthesis transcription factor PdxR n=1 Tax=Mesorhizobium sp. M7A.F.Ca.US.006.01.1.1 TaxID=2496707 RepID=UPI0013E37465|nr:PLP-dependent aminotransferase family protein [Mesorhizobium sp. M7A.F.Ca.US.006.01.1.1]